MKTAFFYTVFLFFISSCSPLPSNKEFWVHNKTNLTIDSLEISNFYSSIKYNGLNQNDSVKLMLNFKDNLKKTDGSYVIQLYMENSSTIKSFGYFSNGIPTEGQFHIYVTDDSLIIKGY